MKKTIIILGLLVACFLGADSFCEVTKNKPSVHIGVVYGFSGAAHKWSEAGRMGLELARDEINASGGINGKPLELIYEDSGTDPAMSVSAYKKLVTQDKVEAIIGNVWSIITNPLIPLTRKDKVVLISPTVMDASIEASSEYFFTMGHRIESLREANRQFYDKNPSVKKVAFLCWEDAWGRANLKIWQEVAKEKEIKVTDTICHGDYNSDYRLEVTKALATKPDAIVTAMYAERVLKRMKEQQAKLPVLATSDVLESYASLLFDRALFEGIYFSYWQPKDSFIKRFKEKYRQEPILEAHNHYEALKALAKAFRKSPDNVLAGLKSLSYEGVAGKVDFSSSPYVNHGQGKLLQFVNGEPCRVDREVERN